MKRKALELEILWGVEALGMSDRIIDDIQAFASVPVLAFAS